MSGLFPLPLQIRWSLLRLKGLWALWNWQHPTSWGWRKVGEGKLCNLWVRVVGSCLLWSHRCTLQFEEDLRQPIQDNCGLLCSSTVAANQKIAAKYSSRGNVWSPSFPHCQKGHGPQLGAGWMQPAPKFSLQVTCTQVHLQHRGCWCDWPSSSWVNSVGCPTQNRFQAWEGLKSRRMRPENPWELTLKIHESSLCPTHCRRAGWFLLSLSGF